MANPEHLKILKKGVEAWNERRGKNQNIIPDLKGANLEGQKLQGADLNSALLDCSVLRGANLYGANLDGVILDHAVLYDANLNGAMLNGASLEETNMEAASLEGASLYGAFLQGAQLSGANLARTNLKDSFLHDANLSFTILNKADLTRVHIWRTYFNQTYLQETIFQQTNLSETVFVNTDLTQAKCLESCKHLNPSALDYQTLTKFGTLPTSFLRGCGLPDSLIDYLPSLTAGPAIQFYSCFISYSASDHEFAERLYADLQNNGVRCWFAPDDLKIGEKFRQRIDESIRVYDKLLLVLSDRSLASEWVESEVESALEKERQEKTSVLFPIRLDNTIVETNQAWAADIRRMRQIGDFSNWKDHDAYKKAFDRLLRDLKESAGE